MKYSYHILMASHLGSDNRHIVIKWALESIAKQTVKPDCVNIAFSYDKRPDIGNWQKILGDIELKLYESPEKLSQFQHYYKIFDVLRKNSSNILMFLDDDDIMHEKRVEIIKNYFETDGLKDVLKHNAEIFWSWELTSPEELNNQIKNKVIAAEYWKNCIKISYIKKIEQKIKEDCPQYNLDYIYYDLLFSAAVNEKDIHYVDKTLYYYRKDQILQKDYRK